MTTRTRFNPMTLAALLVMALLAFAVLSDQEKHAASAATEAPAPTSTPTDLSAQTAESVPAQDDPAEIHAPYDQYILTQGPHGQSYGQLAIDLTAGKGAQILSPIIGQVTALYTDELGNTTLVIENNFWQVTLMHGNYTVSTGEQVTIAQPVGFEHNNGNTVDWFGRSCRGRDCGYHTHLNIFDKRSAQNANPLDLLKP